MQTEITGDYITLGQLLKLAGIIGGGGEVREFLAETAVTVNGEPENRRGRKVRPGDVVSIGNEMITVATDPAAPLDVIP